VTKEKIPPPATMQRMGVMGCRVSPM
jgi:hypothetical protein